MPENRVHSIKRRMVEKIIHHSYHCLDRFAGNIMKTSMPSSLYTIGERGFESAIPEREKVKTEHIELSRCLKIMVSY